ncbi:Vacuolar protein sorting-associated protein 33A Short=hVPS33A [Serendipita indica DSM 11827]|nr:Vacuolar protein sorting-associated protein 33A Short=hVPS33A [Serendipita indica DSM 11827]
MPASVASEETSTKPDDSGIDILALKELAKRSLLEALNSISGAKTLVLDPSLVGPLGLVTEVSFLKQNGLDKMFWLESGPLNAATSNIVYLCRPKIKFAKIIADHIKKHTTAGDKHIYSLILTPRTSTLIAQILEEEGVLGEISILPFNLQFIPLEEDLLSLEHEEAFKEIWLEGDETSLYNSAQALLTLQRLYGLFPRIMGKGEHAERLAKLLMRLNAQQLPAPGVPTFQGLSEKLDSLVIIERRVDMVTPMLTQLTYEGLIDEFIGVSNTYVELPANIVSPPSANANTTQAPALATTPVQAEKKKKYQLSSSSDPLFGELRDLNFAALGATLSTIARRLSSDYESRHNAQTVAQLKEFVGKLGSLQSEQQALRLHTDLAEMIMPYTRTQIFNSTLEIQQNILASYDIPGQLTALEDLIAQGADKRGILRILVLSSLISGGIKTKQLENLKREFLQAYGYELLPALLALETLQLLQSNPLPPSQTHAQSLRLPFAALRKQLRLLIPESEGGSDAAPTDISYVYSGYAPLSVRLVQCVAQMNGVLASLGSGQEGAKGKAKADIKDPAELPKMNAHPIVGWKGFEEVITTIPGPTVDIQQGENVTNPGQTSKILALFGVPGLILASVFGNEHTSTTTVVFFLGGCTFTEISALRWMGKHIKGEFDTSGLAKLERYSGRRFVIATTGVISGNSIVDSLLPKVKVPAPVAGGAS